MPRRLHFLCPPLHSLSPTSHPCRSQSPPRPAREIPPAHVSVEVLPNLSSRACRFRRTACVCATTGALVIPWPPHMLTPLCADGHTTRIWAASARCTPDENVTGRAGRSVSSLAVVHDALRRLKRTVDLGGAKIHACADQVPRVTLFVVEVCGRHAARAGASDSTLARGMEVPLSSEMTLAISRSSSSWRISPRAKVTC